MVSEYYFKTGAEKYCLPHTIAILLYACTSTDEHECNIPGACLEQDKDM